MFTETSYKLKFGESQSSACKLEFLPCIFQKSQDTTNKHIYFDPIVRTADPKYCRNQKDSKQVSLQGRRMIGQEHRLPAGYKGMVYGKTAMEQLDEYEMREVIGLEPLGDFQEVTEWQKDTWHDDRGYVCALLHYAECAKIIHE